MAKPVVKWAGGKKALLGELMALMPERVERYIEPFAGGAALFFALASEAPLRFSRATLCDQNRDLIAMYRALKSQPDALIATLGKYRYDEEMYYQIRELDPEQLDPTERAARLIFLNKTCFNGLWRVNSKGKFNVPFGRFPNPKILDEPRLRDAHQALRKVTIEQGDFAKVTRKAAPGDFIYFDPPYVPVSKTANFTAYGEKGFDATEQLRLATEMRRLRELGVHAVLSNSDTEEVRALYKDFSVRVVLMRRNINSDGGGRAKIAELLVTTWGKPGIMK